MHRLAWVAFGVAAVASVPLIAGLVTSDGGDDAGARTVTACGVGRVRLPPDRMVVRFRIDASAVTATDAVTAGEAAVARVTERLRTAGLQGSAIGVGGPTISAAPGPQGGPVSFTMSRDVVVRAAGTATSLAGTVDAVLGASPEVRLTSFAPEPADAEAEAAALRLAVRDARARAAALAGLTTQPLGAATAVHNVDHCAGHPADARPDDASWLVVRTEVSYTL
jgi:uncharacterized protein YggE